MADACLAKRSTCVLAMQERMAEGNRGLSIFNSLHGKTSHIEKLLPNSFFRV